MARGWIDERWSGGSWRQDSRGSWSQQQQPRGRANGWINYEPKNDDWQTVKRSRGAQWKKTRSNDGWHDFGASQSQQGRTKARPKQPWYPEPPADPLAYEVAKARKTAARRTEVLESSQQRLVASEAWLVAALADVEKMKADVEARTAAAKVADEEPVALEAKIADRESESQQYWDMETQDPKVSPEIFARMRASANPDVIAFLLAYKLIDKPRAQHALANTMPDSDRDEFEAKMNDGAAHGKAGHGASAARSEANPY